MKSMGDPSVDPAKKAEFMKIIQDNMSVMTDEFGEQLKVLHIGDMNIPVDVLTSTGKRKFRDIRETPLRDDDVFIVSYPKTGNMYILVIIKDLLSSLKKNNKQKRNWRIYIKTL